MKLSEVKYILEDSGYIIEDTDEYDDADLGLNVKPKEYHKQKAKMSSLKDRVIQAYEDFIRRKEKDVEWSHFSNKGTKLTGEEVRVLDELNVTVLDVYTGSGKQRTHLDRKDTYYRDEH